MKHFCYQCMIKRKVALCSPQPDCFLYLPHLLSSHGQGTHGKCCIQNATKNNIIYEDFWECLPHPPFSPAMMGANNYPLFISSEINMWWTDGLTSAMHSWKYLLNSLHKIQTVRTCQDSFLLKFESYIQQVVNFDRKQSCCIITACYYTKAYNEHLCLNTLLWPINASIKDSFFWCY